MNIFFLDRDPTQASKMMIDIHVNKMILESSQMLANCYSYIKLCSAPRTQLGNIRSHSHFNHPCSRWVRESKDNFNWLLVHARSLVSEKEFRTGKVHFCEKFISWCEENVPLLPEKGFTPPAQAFGEYSFLKSNDPVTSYRAYYIVAKRVDKNGKRILFWTKRGKPDWFV